MKSLRLLIASFLLATPLLLFCIHQYTAHSPHLIPTGFIQGDDVVYVSNARQHLEGRPGLTYSNPFSSSTSSPRIYTQPYNYLLSFFLAFEGIPPGLILLVFGIISAIGCIYLSLRLVDFLYPELYKKNLIYLLLIWGGGISGIAGLIANVSFLSGRYDDFWSAIYMVDPGNGWWGMNFGRILIISTEAYYHMLFIGGVYLLLRHKWWLSIILSFLLSWSHPFTGVEYLLIICGWLAVEKIFFSNRAIPWLVFLCFGLLLLLHLWYYLYFLNLFPEHKKLFETFSVDWGYSFRVYVPAYLLVFLLAAYTIYKFNAKAVFKIEHQRLFFLWAIIAFLLSNHEWFIKPIQPIHFARGYIWLGLFLFSLPGLVNLLQKFRDRTILLILFALLFLSDNILWYSNILRSTTKNENASYITSDTQQVLNWLQKNTSTNDLLVSNEELVTYLANAYAASYSWTGHVYNTPDFNWKYQQQLAFLQTGVPLPEWKGKRLLIIERKINGYIPVSENLRNNKLFENNTYRIFSF